jgi:hypothetical protein
MKFKVGDRVKQISHLDGSRQSPFCKVVGLENGMIAHIHDGDDMIRYCQEESFVLIKPTEVKQYGIAKFCETINKGV